MKTINIDKEGSHKNVLKWDELRSLKGAKPTGMVVRRKAIFFTLSLLPHLSLLTLSPSNASLYRALLGILNINANGTQSNLVKRELRVTSYLTIF